MVWTYNRIVKVVLYAPMSLSPTPTSQRVGDSLGDGEAYS